MGQALWFPKVTSLDGFTTPPTTLIDYTVNTAFEITNHRLGLLRQEPWAEHVKRRRGDRGVQLIVRVPALPPEFAGANCLEAFRAHITKVLRGW